MATVPEQAVGAVAGSISDLGGVCYETVDTSLEVWPCGAERSKCHEEAQKDSSPRLQG